MFNFAKEIVMATKKAAVKTTGRPKPLVAKGGVTKDGKRRYGCGGKMKKK